MKDPPVATEQHAKKDATLSEVTESCDSNNNMDHHTVPAFTNHERSRPLKTQNNNCHGASDTSSSSSRCQNDEPAPFIELWEQHQVNETLAIEAVQTLWSRHYHNLSYRKNIASFKSISKTTAFHIAKFFLFIYERQCCWRKRNDGTCQHSNIFSENPIFQQYFFCNNYRELDRGTCYFRSQMLLAWERQYKQQQQQEPPLQKLQQSQQLKEPHWQLKWIETVFFASYVYRQVNKIETFVAFGGIPTVSEWPKFAQWAKTCELKPFFTGAHQTAHLQNYLAYVNSLLAQGQEQFQAVTKAIATHIQNYQNEDYENDDDNDKGNVLKACYAILLKLPGCGKFFSWQILCDLMECKCFARRRNHRRHAGGDNDDDDDLENQWTKLGPGAELAIKTIFPNANQYLHLAKALTTLQPLVYTTALQVEFPKVRNKYLTLKNIEHALCEFHKFLKIESTMRLGYVHRKK